MQELAVRNTMPLPYFSFPGCLERYYTQQPPEMSPATSIAGDHIGVESCLDMVKAGEEDAAAGEVDCCYFSERLHQRREQWRELRRKEYPPPIPLLARTENLPSHMPWVLKRYYTSDGRLILKEEKVRHHEYMRAHRADGRLTLHLVPLDDDVTKNDINNDENEEQSCDREQSSSDDTSMYGGGGEDLNGGEYSVVSVAVGGKCLDGIGGNGHGQVGSTCIFGVPISPIRTVHS